MLQFVWQNLRQYTHCVLRCLFRKWPELAILRWLKEDLVNKPIHLFVFFSQKREGQTDRWTDHRCICCPYSLAAQGSCWRSRGAAETWFLDILLRSSDSDLIKVFFFSSEIIMLIMMFYCSSHHLANGVRTFINSELTAADAKMKVILNLLFFWRNNFFNLVRKLCK